MSPAGGSRVAAFVSCLSPMLDRPLCHHLPLSPQPCYFKLPPYPNSQGTPTNSLVHRARLGWNLPLVCHWCSVWGEDTQQRCLSLQDPRHSCGSLPTGSVGRGYQQHSASRLFPGPWPTLMKLSSQDRALPSTLFLCPGASIPVV